MLLVVKINIISWNIYDRLYVYFIFMHGICEESVTEQQPRAKPHKRKTKELARRTESYLSLSLPYRQGPLQIVSLESNPRKQKGGSREKRGKEGQSP